MLKLVFDDTGLPYAQLADELDLSVSQAHAAVRRAEEAGFLLSKKLKVNRRAFVEFLVHGLKYVFPARRGPSARGLPTAHSGPPLRDMVLDEGPAIVWPDAQGTVRGESLEPLHKSVPNAARRDERLYECLALIDAIRIGRARERQLAIKKLKEMILGGR